LRIERDANNNLVMLDEQTPEQEEGGELKTIFENGKLLVETTLDEVRARLASGG
jgi:nicotinamide phosphoribosyltransferase